MTLTLQYRRACHRLQAWLCAVTPVQICLVLGLAAVFPMALLTPPFQVPDEAQHFSRAYELSEFSLWGINQHAQAGALLPSSIATLSDTFLGTRALHAQRPVTQSPLRMTLARMNVALHPQVREFVNFAGIAAYSPISYLPQATAIALVRSAGGTVLALFYAARLANGLVAVLVLACAVRIMPMAKEATLVTGLLPMALSLYASLSPDALAITSAFLFTAVALRALTTHHWRNRDIGLAAMTGLLFTSLKVVYAPLLLLGLPGAAVHRRPTLTAHTVIVTVAVGGTLLWLGSTHSVATFVREGSNASAQFHFMLAHPRHYLGAVKAGFLANRFYYDSAIGVLGWLTVPLPRIGYFLPALALLLAVGIKDASRVRLRLSTTLWGTAILAGCTMLVVMALYLFWTPVGGYIVEGVQGRYFLPLLALGGVVADTLLAVRYLRPVVALWAITALITAEIGLTLMTLIHAYGVFV